MDHDAHLILRRCPSRLDVEELSAYATRFSLADAGDDVDDANFVLKLPTLLSFGLPKGLHGWKKF